MIKVAPEKEPYGNYKNTKRIKFKFSVDKRSLLVVELKSTPNKACEKGL
jgi:hypothetical protein